ncbi:EAL domain-containing protein [Tianweitania sp. BSSL-BM11]|uniref:EAL domain-containing protein n=1 Tax=Tianweitania aestuarii TaxID=2814886 RepID=A0ABS5RYK0_9HYPH|nr:EAL domain-containing protein [Tianweitania aestuarii]MBS9722124.1 EAL domain-containing protein [Tianweitania aestuarii]
MQTVISCIQQAHNGYALLIAALVCTIGVYGSFSVANHAARSEGNRRAILALVAIVSAGCTAWSTHMIALLAFQPGMQAGFELIVTTVSLMAAILGIGAGMLVAIGQHKRRRRLAGGLVLGVGIVALHYLGQSAYVVRGYVSYDHNLVTASIIGSLPIFAVSLMISGERSKRVRLLGAPLLLLAIAVLHLTGMAALSFTFDPSVNFPPLTAHADVLAPIVAAVSLCILGVALVGLRLSLHAQATLRRERQRLGELANLALEGLAICDGDTIVSANETLLRLSGYPQKSLAGSSLRTLVPALDLSHSPEGEEVDATLVTINGDFVPVLTIRREVGLGARKQTVLAFRDQRERLRSESQIRTLAFTDHLTGLANRTRFLDLLAVCIQEEASGSTKDFAILLLDLDGFKSVNDSLGHHGGDVVLKVVADRLIEAVEPSMTVARLGGDEFAILVRDDIDAAGAESLGLKLIRAVEEPIPVGEQVVYLSASVGAKRSQHRGSSSIQILENADLALYDAKARGKGRVRLFSAELRSAADERGRLSNAMRTAWEEGYFELYYQPQVRLSDQSLVGAEALIRYNDPQAGVVSPAAFLPILETSALAVPVGDWILQTASRQAAAWRGAGLCDFGMGVNLFPAQLRSADFVSRVRRVLAETGLPAHALELEITENIVLQNEVLTLEHLAQLRKLGVGVAFDDFGTGFASLTMLKRIEIDRLKIDQSFVRNVEHDPKDQAIVEAIASIAEGCGLNVIAEGIETEAQARFMQASAVEGQGYLFGAPMPAAEFEQHFIKNRHAQLPTFAAA